MERQFIYETEKPRWFNPITLCFVLVAVLFLGLALRYRKQSESFREIKESAMELREQWVNDEGPYSSFGRFVFGEKQRKAERKEWKYQFLAVASAVIAGIMFLVLLLPPINYGKTKKFGMKYSAEIEQDSSDSGTPVHRHGVEYPLIIRTNIDGKDTTIFAARRKSRSSAERRVGATVLISKLGKRVVVCD